MTRDQDSTPYADALLAYAARDPGRFHIPGHRGGPGADPKLSELVGAIPVSRTYFGACAHVRALAETAHAREVPLVVDEAWGAHLHFHPELPEDALSAGADLVISSTHKIVGSLTQSAMLHLGESLL